MNNGLLNILTIAEQNELERCEVVIRQGLETFVEVGTALMTIRNSRLYRAGFSTFEDYCRERWGMERNYANKMIAASQVVANVSMGTVVPTSERQARPLTSLQPETQREAWREVVESHGNGITAAKVQEVVNHWKPVDEEIRQAKDAPMFAAQTPEEIIQAAKTTRPHVANNSGEIEWYTPSEYIEAARRVMGGIDLDPASNDQAQENVKATAYYTIETDGLSQEWKGRVWMNPPYGNGWIDPFIQKLIRHIRHGEISQAIVLVNNATETGWFQDLASVADAICFPRGRIKYLSTNGEKNSPLQGQAFLFFGGMVNDFFREFQAYGVCVTTA